MPWQAQAKGKETGTQRCAQNQRRDREERQKKDERRKHHTVRTHKYGQPGLEPGHSDTHNDVTSISVSLLSLSPSLTDCTSRKICKAQKALLYYCKNQWDVMNVFHLHLRPAPYSLFSAPVSFHHNSRCLRFCLSIKRCYRNAIGANLQWQPLPFFFRVSTRLVCVRWFVLQAQLVQLNFFRCN